MPKDKTKQKIEIDLDFLTKVLKQVEMLHTKMDKITAGQASTPLAITNQVNSKDPHFSYSVSLKTPVAAGDPNDKIKLFISRVNDIMIEFQVDQLSIDYLK
jgi:hypothetical protein